MCEASEYDIHAQKELQVKLGLIDVWGNLRMGIHQIYKGRHSPLIIILNNKRSHKKYENIFSELGRNPTPVKVGPLGKLPILTNSGLCRCLSMLADFSVKIFLSKKTQDFLRL